MFLGICEFWPNIQNNYHKVVNNILFLCFIFLNVCSIYRDALFFILILAIGVFSLFLFINLASSLSVGLVFKTKKKEDNFGFFDTFYCVVVFLSLITTLISIISLLLLPLGLFTFLFLTSWDEYSAHYSAVFLCL